MTPENIITFTIIMIAHAITIFIALKVGNKAGNDLGNQMFRKGEDKDEI